jgi:Ca2+-binding RTX toxin-like protein
MPVITTSVSVNAISTRALTISTNGNYLVTATTFLESQSSYAVGIDPAIGAVTFNLAGSVVANLSYYGIYQTGATDPLTINVLASGSIFGGGVVFSNSQLTLTNDGYLYGEDTGIRSGESNDIVINRGEIYGGPSSAISLAGGADVFTNSGHVTGNVKLEAGDDRFYGGGGSVFGAIDMGIGNDVLDLRDAQITGQVSGSFDDDIYIVDGTSFDLVEVVDQGIDLVKSTVSFELGDNFDNLQLLGAGNLNGTGNFLDNSLIGNAGDNRLHGFAGADALLGGAGDDRLLGDLAADVVYGGIGDDSLFGGAGNDSLAGDTGADRITGGAGRDVLTGDVGSSGGYDDVFIYTKVSDSAAASQSDRITDFKIGEDRIDLSAVDAKSGTPANDAFALVGAFANVAGQLILQASGGDTFVLGDVTGDSVADFRFILSGALVLTAADFIL